MLVLSADNSVASLVQKPICNHFHVNGKVKELIRVGLLLARENARQRKLVFILYVKLAFQRLGERNLSKGALPLIPKLAYLLKIN